MVSESVGFNFWVYSFGCRSIPFYFFNLSPNLCCVRFSKLVVPVVPLLFLEVEELPFDCLLADTKFSSVSFGWVGLENVGELAYLLRPFLGFWGKEGTSTLGVLGS